MDRQDRAAAAEARRFAAAQRGMGGGGGGGRRRGLALKKGWLVAPKDHWPPCEGGLTMEMLPVGLGSGGLTVWGQQLGGCVLWACEGGLSMEMLPGGLRPGGVKAWGQQLGVW